MPAATGLQLGVRPQTGHVVHAGVGDLSRVQAGQYFGCREGAEGGDDLGFQRLAVGVTAGVAVEAGIGGESGIQQHHVAKHPPLALVLQAQHHRATIARRERAVGVDGGVGSGGAGWRGRALEGVVHGVAHPFPKRLQHRHINVAALPGAPAQQQGGEDVGVGVHARRNVGNRVTGFAGIVGRAGDAQETRLALDQQVVGFFVAVGAVFAVA